MAYIGNTAQNQAFTPRVDYFSGNGSTVAFTLSFPVASVAQVQAVIENVPQNPSDAYTVSGNTITFTSAPPSGTNNIYVYYTSPITTVITPGYGTVGPAQLTATGNASSSTYLRGDNSWATVPAGTRISGGTTGLTPNTLTSGDVTLAGTLVVANGGTGTATPSLVGGTNVTISGSWPNQTITATAAAGGKVLQVVQTVKSDTFSTTVQDETFVDITGLSVNITPTSASSRILVFVSLGKISVGVGGRAINFKLLRNSTAIGLGDADGSRIRCTFASHTPSTDVAGRGGAGMSYSYLDSPATTSTTTYKVSMSGHDGDLTCINRSAENQNSADAPHSRTSSTIIVMEIAA